MGALGEGADHVLGIDEVELGGDVKVPASHRGRAIDGDGGRGLVTDAKALERKALDVQDDVGDVLIDALDRRELVLHAVDLDGLHSGALERGEQHAAERVAKRVTIAVLKRLGDDAGNVLADLFYRHVGTDEIGHRNLQPVSTTWSRARR